jgi:spore maturation protein CgeB
MRLVVFGLTISSAWGNGHATLWRALAEGLAQLGHQLTFFERDVHYYHTHRDLFRLPSGELHLYGDWDSVRDAAAAAVDDADVAIVTSYCPDGPAASELVLGSRAPVRAFYDLDTPVTLELLDRGAWPPWLPPGGLAGFDRVLSFTGGAALDALRTRLSARNVAPLYGSVDPAIHMPRPQHVEWDLSYLGTYACDRQPMLERLLVRPAERRPDRAFMVAGSQYPNDLAWPSNVRRLDHVPPPQHAAFYRSARLTLNITRAVMAKLGHCPSGRLFEAAACGVPVLTDRWWGLERFFRPGEEILVAADSDDALAIIERDPEQLAEIGEAARRRVLACHTGLHRAAELVELLGGHSVSTLAVDRFAQSGARP